MKEIKNNSVLSWLHTQKDNDCGTSSVGKTGTINFLITDSFENRQEFSHGQSDVSAKDRKSLSQK